jgi:hypothetical protein
VRPGPALPIAATAVAAAGWLAAVGYGALHFHLLWCLAALAGGAAAVALAARGFPLVAVAPLLAAVLAWGLATRELVPQRATDLAGDARLFGWNLAFAAPLLLAVAAAGWWDARRSAAAAARVAATQRRHAAAPAVEHEPLLAALEEIPATCFFAAQGVRARYGVAAGRRIALVATTVWPRGEYTADGADVLRNGRFFGPGTDDLVAAAADVAAWQTRSRRAGATCRGFLVVDAPGGGADLALPAMGELQVVAAEEFAEVVGGWLAAEAYRLEVAVVELLRTEQERAQPPAPAVGDPA